MLENVKKFCNNPGKVTYTQLDPVIKNSFETWSHICIDKKIGYIEKAREILNFINERAGIPQTHYFSDVLRNPKEVFEYFSNTDLYNSDEESMITLFGKRINIPRKQMAYGNEGLTYTFSGVTVPAKAWFPLLTDVKRQIEYLLGVSFNFVLINYYHDGSKNIGYHSDDETTLYPDSVIASLSLGQTRWFYLKRKKDNKVFKIRLKDNSVVTMEGKCQKLFKHSVPKQSLNIVNLPRINFTFRQIVT
jgi:alkylated DNA repair dioxygenase AlkB